MGKRYEGRRVCGKCIVTVTEAARGVRRLRLRLDLFNHSPTGFEWGYQGSGPAQLALALLADALGDDRRAVRLHQPFKREFVAHLSRDNGWMLDESDIRAFAEAHA